MCAEMKKQSFQMMMEEVVKQGRPCQMMKTLVTVIVIPVQTVTRTLKRALDLTDSPPITFYFC